MGETQVSLFIWTVTYSGVQTEGTVLFTLAQTYLLVKIYFPCYRDRVAKV